MVTEVQEFCLRWNNHHSVLISVLDSLLERETLVDVILAAEGQYMKVHRLVLCACSQYFEELLSEQCDRQAVVFLKDVRFVDLKALVDYMYRGEVNVSQDQLAAFLSTAESLRIKGLADKDDNKSSSGHTTDKPKLHDKNKNRKTASEQCHITQSPLRTATPASSKRSDSPEILESSSPPSTSHQFVSMMDHVDFDETGAAVDSDDHFIGVEPKLENEDNEVDITMEHIESKDTWSAKETEEEWSNSEVQSASPSEMTGANPSSLVQEPWPKENDAGPSLPKTRTKSSRSNSSRGRCKMDHIACSSCGKSYTNKRNFVRHQNYECGREPSFSCYVCKLRFRRKDNMKAHHLRQHPGVPLIILTG